jgi:hypothetical protein
MNLKAVCATADCRHQIASRAVGFDRLRRLDSHNFIADNYGDGIATCTAASPTTARETAAGCMPVPARSAKPRSSKPGDGIESCNTVVKNNHRLQQVDGIYGPATNSYNCLWQNVGGNFFNNFAKTGTTATALCGQRSLGRSQYAE